jgi:CubicO group peptidase (beta-lactamase class C family)
MIFSGFQRFRPFLVALALVVTALPSRADVDPDRLAAITEEGMALWHVPGLAVAVVTPDEILFRQGFGTTSIEDGAAVDEHTLFAIASTTKAMVTAGILMLADEGKISLDDPVIEYLPELRFSVPLLTEQIMVSDLLAHRTGLPSTNLWTFFMNMPLDEQIQSLQHVDMEAPVRTRLIYQNTMFDLAGVIIERLSGQRWDVFLTERLWHPIGMMETFGARSQIPARLSHVMPHQFEDGQLLVTGWDLPADNAHASGSVWSSIHDMSMWAQFLLRGGVTADGQRLVSEEKFADMFEPHQLAGPEDFYPTIQLTRPNWRSYGLGWFQQDFQGRKIDFHTGSLNGLIAIIGLDRANGAAVIVLGNRDHAEMRHALLWDVMDRSAEAAKRDWNREVFDLYANADRDREARWKETESKRLKKTRPSLKLSAYAGTYRSARNGEIRIVEENGRLALQAPLVTLGLSHWHVDTFLTEYRPWDLREFARFQLMPDGSIASLEFFGDVFRRVD